MPFVDITVRIPNETIRVDVTMVDEASNAELSETEKALSAWMNHVVGSMMKGFADSLEQTLSLPAMKDLTVGILAHRSEHGQWPSNLRQVSRALRKHGHEASSLEELKDVKFVTDTAGNLHVTLATVKGVESTFEFENDLGEDVDQSRKEKEE